MTKTPVHPFIEGFFCEWFDFKDTLDKELQDDFENLMLLANKHNHTDPEGITFQQIIMSILIEHEKEISRLKDELISSDFKGNHYFSI